MKKLCAMLVPVIFAAGCTKMVTAPIKVAGKVATTSIGVAGDVAAAGVKSGSKVVKSTGADPAVVNAAVLLAK